MINLKTDNPLLLEERAKAAKYLTENVLDESALKLGIVDDLINLTEVRLNDMEINEKNISLAYSLIYSTDLKNALPIHVLKEPMVFGENLRVVP